MNQSCESKGRSVPTRQDDNDTTRDNSNVEIDAIITTGLNFFHPPFSDLYIFQLLQHSSNMNRQNSIKLY